MQRFRWHTIVLRLAPRIGDGPADWVPWTGSAGEAQAKILGTADGYMVTLVEAQPGYAGSARAR